MKLLKKNRIKTNIFLLLTVGLVISVFGSIIGTFAWYEYNSTVKVHYGGTAIGETDSVQLGLVTESKFTGYDTSKLIEDKESLEGKYVYWSINGGIDSETFMSYERFLGHASNRMYTTTSSSYEVGGLFDLKIAPERLKDNLGTSAPKEQYSFLRLALKRAGGEFDFFFKNTEVSCQNNLRNAVRIHCSNPNEPSNSFLYAPAYYDEGKTDVGGLLNLDCLSESNFDYLNFKDKEYIYGEVTGLTYSGERYTDDPTIPLKECTCFHSNHKKGYLIPTFTPKTASYKGMNQVLNSKELTHTIPNTGIALLDLTMYIEGWDHSCIDSVSQHSYNLSMDFGYRNREA